MKTNLIMRRPMGQFEVLQRTSDGYFDATFLHEKVEIDDFASLFYSEEESPIKIEDGKVWYEQCLFQYALQVLENIEKERVQVSDEIKSMSFDDALKIIGLDGILRYIGINIQASESKENIFFKPIEAAISASNDSNLQYRREYSIDSGEYRLDMLITRVCPILKVVAYTIIEYDEPYHDSNSQIKKDAAREKAIFKYLSKKRYEDYDINIDILRVHEGDEGAVYLYFLPYITGIDTSYCSDKFQEMLDYRLVLCRELDIDLIH